jgi:pyruvate,water dikinase
MQPFYALKDIATVPPWQVGETACWLHRLQQSGEQIPDSWVISVASFQQTLHKLIAREPLYADWPQLLWQAAQTEETSIQHLARRLRRPLMNSPLDFPWQSLLSHVNQPMVRLIPSLWLGDNLPAAPLAQTLGTPVCWAEADILESALKQLWADVVSARSLAFWGHRPAAGEAAPQAYPEDFGVAVIIQAVEPVTVSGTLTIRADTVEIEAVQGLPRAIAESCPDYYQGSLETWQQHTWQRGYQEVSYQPAEDLRATDPLEFCLAPHPLAATALDVLDAEMQMALAALAQRLWHQSKQPLRVEWLLTHCQGVPQIAQAFGWPLVPGDSPWLGAGLTDSQTLAGYPASSGQVQGSALVLLPEAPLPATAHQCIIIAAEVSPDWLPLLKTAAAVVSERGGLTSHAAVLARELGLPAVVGVMGATDRIQTGDLLAVDGDRGTIVPLQAPVSLVPNPSPSPAPSLHRLPSQTEIWLNLSQPEVAASLSALPVAGVGLLRSEWLMMPVLERQHPYYWIERGQPDELKERLLDPLRPIVKAFFPRPVRYRSLDIRSNEFAQLRGAPAIEANPMLGIRGTFSYQQHPQFFQLELEILKLLQDEGYTNLQLILPFVRSVEEVVGCQRSIQAVGLHHNPNFALWIMAEVPTVLFLLPQYVTAGVQGIAIGTHDLTQLLLGIDRDQALFSAHYDERHPAVQAAIAQLIQQARDLHLPCVLCGVSPTHHPHFIEAMVQSGVSGISIDAGAVPFTANLLQQLETGVRTPL